MQNEFTKAINEANRIDRTDICYRPSQYFWCGCNAEPYHNNWFAIAISIIGQVYNYSMNQNSNYHNGIAYIAEQSGVSKAQVKALRKKMKTIGGFQFRTPYKIADIIEIMIECLKDKERLECVKMLVEKAERRIYRDILIEEEYDAIRIAAETGRRKAVLEIEGKLEHLAQEYGRN